jgi:hypothetical protein
MCAFLVLHHALNAQVPLPFPFAPLTCSFRPRAPCAPSTTHTIRPVRIACPIQHGFYSREASRDSDDESIEPSSRSGSKGGTGAGAGVAPPAAPVSSPNDTIFNSGMLAARPGGGTGSAANSARKRATSDGAGRASPTGGLVPKGLPGSEHNYKELSSALLSPSAGGTMTRNTTTTTTTSTHSR